MAIGCVSKSVLNRRAKLITLVAIPAKSKSKKDPLTVRQKAANPSFLNT